MITLENKYCIFEKERTTNVVPAIVNLCGISVVHIRSVDLSIRTSTVWFRIVMSLLLPSLRGIS